MRSISESSSINCPQSPENQAAPTGVIVQKYGGSSLATLGQIRAVAKRVAASHSRLRPIVVVVSARGGTTDGLIELTGNLSSSPSPRETDQLLATAEAASAAQVAMALDTLNVSAISLTGDQAGIRTSGRHGEARIADISPERVCALLQHGFVPVISGFQGVNSNGDMATLGRGGSDTTAVALAAALNARQCEINTDVDGVFTADPQIVSKSRILPKVDCVTMAEMARSGARILHSRSVDLASLRDVEVHIRHTARPGSGSVVIKEGEIQVESAEGIVAITHDSDTAEVSLVVDPTDYALLPETLDDLADIDIDIDLLSWLSDVTCMRVRFTVPRSRVADARAVLDKAGLSSQIEETLGKVSIIGSSAVSGSVHPARALRALGEAGIPGNSVHTAHRRTSMLVPRDKLTDSVNVLHTAFGLDADPQNPHSVSTGAPTAPAPR